jgi:hypothetical protein
VTLAGPGNPPKRWLRGLITRIHARAARHASAATHYALRVELWRRQHAAEVRDTPAGVARRFRLLQRIGAYELAHTAHATTAQRARTLADRILELAP